jgi:hypothetical protein
MTEMKSSAPMKTPNRRMLVALAVVAGTLILVGGLALILRGEKAESWKAVAEGFLAVATPCCTEASLWDALDITTPDGQRARPASASEAARWLNQWPYRNEREDDRSEEAQLSVSLQNSEVRCVGPATGGKIPQRGRDEETLETIRHRRECVYAKWKVWSGETAEERENERHTVWADEDGAFHGRVDYWRR